MGERGDQSGFSLARSLMKQKKLKTVIALVFAWYERNARDLPWRKTSHPYRILVSEVMLQQTQVDRVIEKYKEFLRAFPTVLALASAAPRDVIIAWQGLGYNRRALFLQKTAQAILEKHDGTFPKDLALLKALPGVGDYTARAILSFAFDRLVPMMDTNHRQFYERVFFGGRSTPDRVLLDLAEEMLPIIREAWNMEHGTNIFLFEKKKSAVYHWNQALMDFMSAFRTYDVGRIDDPLLAKFTRVFPAGKRKKKTEKKFVRFQVSDRWYRGKIIDMLRERPRVSFSHLQKKFQTIPDARLQKIVSGLEKDGLIVRKNFGIMITV